jgi:hypothetical protein
LVLLGLVFANPLSHQSFSMFLQCFFSEN